MNPSAVGTSWQVLLALTMAGSTIATAIFWSAFYLGDYNARLRQAERATNELWTAVRELRDEVRQSRR